jgi:hypothetical protein
MKKKLIGDEKQKREPSPAAGGRHSRDPERTAEETTDDGET